MSSQTEPPRDPFAMLCATLWQDEAPKLLAHYTSLEAFENILRSNEIWFSNPLFMNDWQELRFGVKEGSSLLLESDLFEKAAGSEHRASKIRKAFQYYLSNYDRDEAFNTYVFCLTNHIEEDQDGLLSMWRGYGQHGAGVAIIFDSQAVTEVPESPLNIAKVRYYSDGDRRKELESILREWARITRSIEWKDDQIHAPAHVALWLIKTFALTTKHKGFSEEAEWRVIYYPDRDPKKLLADCKSYHIGPRGLEPKLKLKIDFLPGVTPPDLALDRIVHSVILGPSHSSPLAIMNVRRMFEAIGIHGLDDKVLASGIPLRSDRGSSF